MGRGRGYNREQRERVVKNRKRLMRDTGLKHQKMEQDGRYVKQHPYDCGKADCGVCSGHKRHGCESKNKDEHVLLEIEIAKEVQLELKEEDTSL